jgi:uncharacterized protein YdeI (YjbR/CyaY-like superfamily)
MEEVFVQNIKDLEHWLEKNVEKKESIWLVYYKFSSGLGNITRDNLVDTLLCYGWVDSLPGKVDDVRTKVRISPRNPKSAWSRINKLKVEKLIQSGKMKKQGYEVVYAAKNNGAWDKLNDVDKLVVPSDFQEYLEKNNLQNTWDSYSRSKKRGLLEFLLNRKSREAREKFMKSIVS